MLDRATGTPPQRSLVHPVVAGAELGPQWLEEWSATCKWSSCASPNRLLAGGGVAEVSCLAPCTRFRRGGLV